MICAVWYTDILSETRSILKGVDQAQMKCYPKFMNTFWAWSGHLKLLFDNSNRFRNGPDADKWFYGEVNLIKKYPVWYKSVKPIFHHIFWTQCFEICYLLVLIWSVSDAFFKHEAHFLCKLVISRFFCNLLFVAVIWGDFLQFVICCCYLEWFGAQLPPRTFNLFAINRYQRGLANSTNLILAFICWSLSF